MYSDVQKGTCVVSLPGRFQFQIWGVYARKTLPRCICISEAGYVGVGKCDEGLNVSYVMHIGAHDI